MTAVFAVDAGGSRTELAWPGGRRRFGSVNPASAGDWPAAVRLRELFTAVRTEVRGADALVWYASAALDPQAPSAELDRVRAVAEGLRVVVCNDAVPLLLAGDGSGDVVAVVCGTGSGVLVGGPRRAPVRVGGQEYLGSDEGSAFDLGVAGLRAAVRASDGRGPATELTSRLRRRTGTDAGQLARDLAARPFPKAPVAAFAPVVTEAWLAGDRVAAELVAGAVDALADAVRAGRDRAALAPGWTLVATGGVVAGCPPFLEALALRARGLGAAATRLVTDPAGDLLAFAGRVPRAWAGVCAWELGRVTASG